MLYYKPEQKIYSSRKELRKILGTYEYKRQFKKGNIITINDNDFIKKVESVTIMDNSTKNKRCNNYDGKNSDR